MKKEMLTKILPLLLCLLLATAFALTACGGEEDDEAANNYGAPKGDKVEVDPYSQMSDAELEALKKEAEVMNKDKDNFIGTWKADDEVAYDLYGGLVVTINEDGSFIADVSNGEEIYHGTWKKSPDGVEFTSELLSGTLYYGDTCQMTINNSEWDYDEEEMAVTMEKVK